MSTPDFTRLALDLGPTGTGPTRDTWKPPEGLTVETAYGAEVQRCKGPSAPSTWRGRFARRRPAGCAADVPHQLD